MDRKSIICAFAKCPKPGMVKKLLEGTLGMEQAAFLARAFLMDTISNALRVKNTSMVLAYWPPDAGKDFEEIVLLFSREEKNKRIRDKSADIILIPQQGADLGERMSNASDALFGDGAKKILFVSSDCPQLDPLIFRAALKLLNKKQVVLGPTFDGGYYILGIKKSHPEIFNGISWGTPGVYKETARILDAGRIDWQELELTYDIDTSEDLDQLYSEIDTLRLTGENSICYHTEKCLKNLAK